MKTRSLPFLGITALIFLMLGGCQNPTTLHTETPVSSTNTPLPAPTATQTSTPTITPLPTATFTPTPILLTIPAGQVEAPILLYHHVTDAEDKLESQYNVIPAKFEEQMKWLSDNGYQTITVTEVADLIRNGGEIPQRPVVVTFDDGNLDVFTNAYPIMKKYGFVATFYVVESYINGEDMVTTDQLKELIQNGWEIGSHSRKSRRIDGRWD